MRILRHRVAGLLPRVPGLVWSSPSDLAEAFFARELAASPACFWLDAGTHADSGMSYLGTGEPVLDADVAAEARELRAVDPADTSVPLGLVGWLRYDRGPAQGVPIGGDLLRVDRAVAVDHAAKTVELIVLGESWTTALVRWRDRTEEILRSVTTPDGLVDASPPRGSRKLTDSTPSAGSSPPGSRPVVWHDSDVEYLAKIDACQRAIRDGDAYQLCLTTEARVPGAHDAGRIYRALRRSSPSHHGGFLRIDDTCLLSASPERFLSVTTRGVVRTRPIKGTRPRHPDPSRDAELAAGLATDPKERAENLMIVDLTRNDLIRVCEPGSVEVSELFRVETYPQVHQLVSEVRGRLAPGRHPVDVLEATFPAGSMTGAPKRRAIEILAGLEQRDRGVYSGAFGWIGADGGMELAMVIRSIVVDAAGASVGAGGGITSSSVPEAELAEVKLKAAALLCVLGDSP